MVNPKVTVKRGMGISLDPWFVHTFAELLIDHSCDHQYLVTVGGGSTARAYNRVAEMLAQRSSRYNGLAKARQVLALRDQVGIEATVLNARLLQVALGNQAYRLLIRDPSAAVKTRKPVIIGHGFKPGRSTDWCAVERARTAMADLVINVSNVLRVFDKDPRKHPSAKPFDHLTWEQYLSFIPKEWTPGLSTPFDPVASRLARQWNIQVAVVSGDLNNLKKLLEGQEFIGTIIGG